MYGINKEGKIYRKTKILNRRDNENENEMIENKVEEDGEEDGETRGAQLQKCNNLTPNTDFTNDSKCNSCTNASRNIDNGIEKVTNMVIPWLI